MGFDNDKNYLGGHLKWLADFEITPEIAKNAVADACTGSNPRQPSVEEMEKLLKCCYYDTEVDF